MYVSSDEFYARLLNDALMGLGTNDLRLIRIIIARSEIDLDEIQKTYLKIYGHSLISDVKVSYALVLSTRQYIKHTYTHIMVNHDSINIKTISYIITIPKENIFENQSTSINWPW